MIGVTPAHEPFAAVSVCPFWAVPLMAGNELFTGGLAVVRAAAAKADADMTVSRLAVRASNNDMRLIVYLSLGA